MKSVSVTPIRLAIGRQTTTGAVRLTSMIRPPSIKSVRFVLTPILSLWVAGAGCLLGCEGMVAATVASAGPEKHSAHHSARKASIVASGHACSSAGSHSCCTNNAREAKPEVKRTSQSDTALVALGGSSSGMMKDCPLAVGKAAIAAKIRTKEVAAAPVLPHSTLPAENVLERTSPLSDTARLPNRGHTYLRCCVFLI